MPLDGPQTADDKQELDAEKSTLILDMLRPAIDKLHQQIRLTRASQYNLCERIVDLSQNVKDVAEDKCAPYDLDVYVRKLENAMARVKSTESTLKDTHDRLSRLQRQIAREVYQQKQRLKQSPSPK